MLDHLGDLLRTQVLKKEKELIDKQIEEAEKLAGELCFLILAHKMCMMIVFITCRWFIVFIFTTFKQPEGYTH